MKERLRKLSSRLAGKGLTSEASVLLSMASYTVSPKMMSAYKTAVENVKHEFTALTSAIEKHMATTYADPGQLQTAIQNITIHQEDLGRLLKVLDKQLTDEWRNELSDFRASVETED